MKKLIAGLVAGLVLALPLSASATGIDKDKAQHIGACYAAELTLREMKPFRNWKPWQRVLFTTVVIGGAKEWYDHNHPSSHSAEWGDIAADFIGASGAEGTIWLVHKTW
jgi:hypothetical protein